MKTDNHHHHPHTHTHINIKENTNYIVSAFNKKILNIQTSSQLRLLLSTESSLSFKSIFIFIIAAIQHFPHNIAMFYEILSQLIDKVNSTTHPISSKIEIIDTMIIKHLFIDQYATYINVINKNFEYIFSENNVYYYLIYEISKHNITIFIFDILVTFSYLIYDYGVVNASTTQHHKMQTRKETYHILQKIKQKYICVDLDRIYCAGCSLHAQTFIITYMNTFLCGTNNNNDKDKDNSLLLNKQIHSVSKMINSIRTNIVVLENIIKQQQDNNNNVLKEIESIFNKMNYHSQQYTIQFTP